jgi:hypothetical protein
MIMVVRRPLYARRRRWNIEVHRSACSVSWSQEWEFCKFAKRVYSWATFNHSTLSVIVAIVIISFNFHIHFDWVKFFSKETYIGRGSDAVWVNLLMGLARFTDCAEADRFALWGLKVEFLFNCSHFSAHRNEMCWAGAIYMALYWQTN